MGRSPPHCSKNEGFWDRSLRQRTKHKRRLSGDASLDAYEMPKPKGMWWRTFYRLQRAAQAAEDRAAEDFITAARWLLKVGPLVLSPWPPARRRNDPRTSFEAPKFTTG